MALSGLPKHPTQNAKLEQYVTDGNVAAQWLAAIDMEEPFADQAEGIADLGAGNGILGIGALLLGAPRAIFVEVDAAACEALEAGLREHDLSQRATVLRADVREVEDALRGCDVVVMNPPWGQQRRSADRPFLEAAAAAAQRSVHLLHSAGAVHVEPWAADCGWVARRWMEAQLPLPRTYAHQQQRRGSTPAAMWWLRRGSPSGGPATAAQPC